MYPSANDSFQAVPVAAVLATFGWHVVAVVYEDLPYGSGILPALAGMMQGVDASIIDRAVVPTLRQICFVGAANGHL